MAHDVFISYSNRDSQIANALCHMLEEEKIKCWIAPRDIKIGEVWADAIAAAIPNSKVVIIILSINSNSSRQVLREIELAIHNNIVVLPVRIEDILPTGGMSYYLSTTHWIDVIDDSIESKIAAIISRIRNILDGSGYIENDQIKIDLSKKSDKSEAKKPPKSNRKKTIAALSSVVFLAAVGLTLFFMRDVIFDKLGDIAATSTTNTPLPSGDQAQSQIQDMTVDSEATAIPTETRNLETVVWAPEDFGYDPDMEIYIPNKTLREAIIQTLENAGEPIKDYITVSDMFHIKELYIASPNNSPEIDDVDERNLLQNEQCIVTNGIIDNLAGMQYAKNMRAFIQINFSDDGVRNLSQLSELYNLEVLYLSGFHITEIDALAELKNLWFLKIYNSYISDISILSGLEKLETLMLPWNIGITDVSAIRELSTLEVLCINNSTGIDDLSYLSHSPMIRSIEHLALQGTDIDNIEFLSDAYCLQSLSIDDIYIADISVLGELGLKELWLSYETYNNNLETVNLLISNGCHVQPI